MAQAISPDQSKRPVSQHKSPSGNRLRAGLVGTGIVLAVAAIAWFALGPGATRTGGAQAFKVCGWLAGGNCVFDGDTIRFDGEKIRIADLDAPETHKPRCEYEAELGRKATARLLQLLNEGPVKIVPKGGPSHDRFGRKLMIVKRNGRSVGEQLIAEGLARRSGGLGRSWCH